MCRIYLLRLFKCRCYRKVSHHDRLRLLWLDHHTKPNLGRLKLHPYTTQPPHTGHYIYTQTIGPNSICSDTVVVACSSTYFTPVQGGLATYCTRLQSGCSLSSIKPVALRQPVCRWQSSSTEGGDCGINEFGLRYVATGFPLIVR